MTPLHCQGCFASANVNCLLWGHFDMISLRFFNITQSSGSVLKPFLPTVMCIFSALQRSYVLAPALYGYAFFTIDHFVAWVFPLSLNSQIFSASAVPFLSEPGSSRLFFRQASLLKDDICSLYLCLNVRFPSLPSPHIPKQQEGFSPSASTIAWYTTFWALQFPGIGQSCFLFFGQLHPASLFGLVLLSTFAFLLRQPFYFTVVSSKTFCCR